MHPSDPDRDFPRAAERVLAAAPAIDDVDPAETGEWLDALDAVVHADGKERAQYLFDRLADHALTRGVQSARARITPYRNTVALSAQPPYPGDLELEARLGAAMRWNALAMVVRANTEAGELGGHIASYASAADLFEVGGIFTAPHLLDEAVYGLTEVCRAELPGARLVANPGCYPTSVLLALRPLMLSDMPIAGPIIADSASGVSGAGRSPTATTHFVQVAGNYAPYKIGRAHRHLPEMEQALRRWRADAPPLLFSPHLLPVPRGILSTIYVTFAGEVDEDDLRARYATAYDDEPFVDVLPAGQLASLAHVNHTNRCAIALTLTGRTLILTAAIDNLIKGAAGQAVQNMNVMFGCPETSGLI